MSIRGTGGGGGAAFTSTSGQNILQNIFLSNTVTSVGYRPPVDGEINIKGLRKTLFSMSMGWMRWGVPAKRQWAGTLREVCIGVIDSCDDYLTRTKP